MMRVGAHVSTQGGVENTPINAHAIGAKAFALFTKNQRQWRAKRLSEDNISAFKMYCQKYGFGAQHILVHDSYLINLGHPDREAREKSQHALTEEIKRCGQLGLGLLNCHPGSHLKRISETDCLELIAESLNIAHQRTEHVIILLENTTGQGGNLGHRFEQIAEIIERVDDKSRIGVCLDTCHAFAAGYDLRTKKAYRETITRLDRIIGLSYLKGVHLNDSKGELGSRIDRHAPLGQGMIGLKPFSFFMNDRRFENIPMVLETPDRTLWPNEISILYRFIL